MPKLFGRWAKFFHFCCQKIWQLCQNCSLRVQRNVWRFFLEGKVIVGAFSVAERKYPAFSKKFMEGLPKGLFTWPQQNFEKKWQKLFLLLSSFLGLWVSFFWFWQKNSQVCRNSNLSVQSKKVEKFTVEQMVFRLFWTLTTKTCFLAESFLQGCQNYFLRVQRINYRATFLKRGLEILKVFGWFLKILGQWRKTFFRVGKTAKDVRGNSLWKIFFQKRNFCYFFRFWAFFFTSSENFCQMCKSRSLRVLGSLWGKTFFEINKNFYTSLAFDPKNP